ncbi:hypothetical protein OG311_36565 [Streptomyces sp. NBC_01343]|nr:hypothetical protein OG311_36565 [Streptomyces sp. NBC_01343]
MSTDQARQALAYGIPACPHDRPDNPSGDRGERPTAR